MKGAFLPGILPFADLLRELFVVLTLAVAGYTDYRKREVDDKVWVVGSLATAPLLAATLSSLRLDLYLVSLTLAASLALFVWKFKLMGEADAIALAFVGLAEPPSATSILTLIPLATIVTLAGLASLLYALYNVALNIAKKPRFDGETSLLRRLVMLATMRYVNLEEYRRRSYMYAPVQGLEASSLIRVPEGEAPPPSEEFWAVVGLPYVTLLAVGYLLYLALKHGSALLSV